MFQSYAFTNLAASAFATKPVLIKGIGFGSSNIPANPNQTCLLGKDQFYCEVYPRHDGNVIYYKLNFTQDIAFDIYEIGLFKDECAREMYFRGVFRSALRIRNTSLYPQTFILRLKLNEFP